MRLVDVLREVFPRYTITEDGAKVTLDTGCINLAGSEMDNISRAIRVFGKSYILYKDNTIKIEIL